MLMLSHLLIYPAAHNSNACEPHSVACFFTCSGDSSFLFFFFLKKKEQASSLSNQRPF